MIPAEFNYALQRHSMALDLLFEVVERTGNFREGYYSLRRIVEHLSTPQPGSIEDVLKAIHNLTATIQAEADGIDQ